MVLLIRCVFRVRFCLTSFSISKDGGQTDLLAGKMQAKLSSFLFENNINQLLVVLDKELGGTMGLLFAFALNALAKKKTFKSFP
jgi:hypothetical protein